MPDSKYISRAIRQIGGNVSATITGDTYADIAWGEGVTPLDETELMTLAQSLEDSAEIDELRVVRDRLLTSTDWTQGNDSPLSDSDKTAWATYRQALRDITDTYSSLDTVVWPTKPE